MLPAGDLHFYMRHSFQAAPPSEASHKPGHKASHRAQTAAPKDLRADRWAQKASRDEPRAGTTLADAKSEAVNGLNGNHHGGSEGKQAWRAITEEALRKLQGSGTGAGDARPHSASPAVSSVSVTGLSRSASFASMDSQGNVDSGNHRGKALTFRWIGI